MPCAASSANIRRPCRFSGVSRATAIMLTTKKLILASASPRRAQILREAGIRHEIARAKIDESPKRGEPARAMTRRLARAKARAVAQTLKKKRSDAIVIGADTTVEIDGRLLGKPRS